MTTPLQLPHGDNNAIRKERGAIIKAAVLEFLATAPRSTSTQVATAFGIPTESVRGQINMLRAAGKVRPCTPDENSTPRVIEWELGEEENYAHSTHTGAIWTRAVQLGVRRIDALMIALYGHAGPGEARV
jgi:hypothetical protein